jgi:hypothetical protein
MARIVAITENVPIRLAMKSGVSFATTTPLPRTVAEGTHGLEALRGGARVRDQFQQMQVARRIEEVRAQEARAQRLRQHRRHVGDRVPRCIRGHDRALFQVRRDGFEQYFLDVEFLDHGFEDPVAVLELGEIVLEVTDGNAARTRGGEERGWLRLQRALQAAPREGVAVLARGRIALYLGA